MTRQLSGVVCAVVGGLAAHIGLSVLGLAALLWLQLILTLLLGAGLWILTAHMLHIVYRRATERARYRNTYPE